MMCSYKYTMRLAIAVSLIPVIFVALGCKREPGEDGRKRVEKPQASPFVKLPLTGAKGETRRGDVHFNMPAAAALIADVSGTMRHYQPTGGTHGRKVLDYLVNNLDAVWIPKYVVPRQDPSSTARQCRLAIMEYYALGSRVRRYHGSVSYHSIRTSTPSALTSHTALDEGMKLVTELLSGAEQRVSMVILLSDMQIDTDGGNGCSAGQAPYCTVERLRPLYAKNPKPGWWLIGFQAPYRGKTRPLFLSIWSYDIAETREMIKDIVADVSTALKDQIRADSIHVLELYPADSWKPVMAGHWDPSGRIYLGRDIRWAERESCFLVSKGYRDIELNWEVDRFMQGERAFETPYEQKIAVHKGSSSFSDATINLQLRGKEIGLKTAFKAKDFKGSFRNPDTFELFLTASPEYNFEKLAWLTEWNGQIPRLKNVVDGATQLADVRGETVTSSPILLKFKKR